MIERLKESGGWAFGFKVTGKVTAEEVKAEIDALIEPAAVKTKRRRGKSANGHVRMRLAQHVERGAIHALAAVRHQMTLVDQHQVAPAEALGRAKHGPDRGEDDLPVPVAAAERGAIDTERRVRPEREQMRDVLFDQFLDVD